jgi:cation diffusion facilitator family transporter
VSSRRGSSATVLLAGSANLAIAVAKLVGGLLAGSSAMLSEAAHSFADTLNQVFLMAALRRSDKPADDAHPFGYGKERYFWSLLAAVAVFVLGAGFSIYQGIAALVHPETEKSPTVALAILAVALLMEGSSLGRAFWQLRGEARTQGHGLLRHLLREAEPTVRAVAFEDSAAVVGILLAATGLVLDAVLHTAVYDAIASLAIGVLLIGVAAVLGKQNQEMLIGRAADPELVEGIRREVEGVAGIDHVVQLLTMQLGPEELLMAARVSVVHETSGRDLELVSDEVERVVRAAYPQVRHVFLDPTPGHDEDAPEAEPATS